jgi:hypothetical protein
VAGVGERSRAVVQAQGFAAPGTPIAVAAGMPFGTASPADLLHITEA